jgi:hypothetical protein
MVCHHPIEALFIRVCSSRCSEADYWGSPLVGGAHAAALCGKGAKQRDQQSRT